MNYRIAMIQSKEAIVGDISKVYDINVQDPISQIIVQYKGKNNGVAPSGHPAKLISKIELVDGSDVLFSMSGIDIQAMDYYHTGRSTFQILDYFDDVSVVPLCVLHFGRYLYDPQLAFDPKKFTNPQLRVTIDIDAGGCSPDAGTLEIMAHVFDQRKIHPSGFLMTKEVYSYTLNGATNEYIDLPTDFPYRLMTIGALVAQRQPWQEYNEIKLSEDNDKRVILNNKTSDLLKYLLGRYPVINETFQGQTDNSGVTFYVTPAYQANIVCGQYSPGAATEEIASSYLYGGSVQVSSDTSVAQFKGLVQGYAPHARLGIPFGNLQEISDWYDVRKVGNLQAIIKGGSGSSGNCKMCIQQFRHY